MKFVKYHGWLVDVFLMRAVMLPTGDFHHYSKISATTVTEINWSVSHSACLCLLAEAMLQHLFSLPFARMKNEFHSSAWNLFPEFNVVVFVYIYVYLIVAHKAVQGYLYRSGNYWATSVLSFIHTGLDFKIASSHAHLSAKMTTLRIKPVGCNVCPWQ